MKRHLRLMSILSWTLIGMGSASYLAVLYVLNRDRIEGWRNDWEHSPPAQFAASIRSTLMAEEGIESDGA